MSRWVPEFYSGDYGERQRAANRAGAVVYLEGHANSGSSMADYAMAVVSQRHSEKSMQIAKEFAATVGKLFDVGGAHDTDIYSSTGVRVGGRGDGNLSQTTMPAVLLEPGFGSNPVQARRMESEEGLDQLGHVIAGLVRKHFPDGGLVAFSIGHVGKKSAPKDRGAAWNGIRFKNEAEYAREYLSRAASFLAAS